MSSCASRRCAASKMRSESRLAMVSDSRDLSSAIDLALAVASAAANWRLASRRSRFCAAASSLRSYCAWSSACGWGWRRGNSRRRQWATAPSFGGCQKTRVDLRCEVNARWRVRGRDGGVPRFGRGAAGRGAHLACVVPLGDVIDAVDESLRLDRLGPEPGLAKGLGLLRRKGRGDPRSTLSARRNGQGRTLRFDARSHLEPAVDGGASVVLDGGLHANRGGSLFVDALVVEGRGRGLARLRGSDEEFAPRVLLRVKVKSFWSDCRETGRAPRRRAGVSGPCETR